MAGDSDKLAPRTSVDEEMVRSLARLLDETRLTEIEIEQDGLRVRVARQPAPAPYAYDPNAGVHVTSAGYGNGALRGTVTAQPGVAIRLGHVRQLHGRNRGKPRNHTAKRRCVCRQTIRAR